MATITCSDPLHASRSGEPGWSNDLGTTDADTSPPGYLCGACSAAAKAIAPTPPSDPAALIAAARESVATASTVAQLRTRTLALDDLRAQYPNVT